MTYFSDTFTQIFTNPRMLAFQKCIVETVCPNGTDCQIFRVWLTDSITRLHSNLTHHLHGTDIY